MDAVRINSTGIGADLDLSQIGFGTAPIGGLGSNVSQEQGVAALRHAMELGVNYLDSALLYGGGKGLETLGIALGERPPVNLVISFKVGRILVTGSDDPWVSGKPIHVDGVYVSRPQFVYDYSREGIRRAFEQSMQHLNAGRIPFGMEVLKPEQLNIVVYVHDPDKRVHGSGWYPWILTQVRDESFPELLKMQEEGLISAYGVGSNEVETCHECLKDSAVKLLMLAGRGTLFCNGASAAPADIKEDSNGLNDLLSAVNSHHNETKLVIAAIGNSGLGYGGRTYNYAEASSTIIEFREKMETALADYNREKCATVKMTDLLVGFPLTFLGKAVASVVSGPRSIREVEDVVHAYTAKVPDDLWDRFCAHGLLNNHLLRNT